MDPSYLPISTLGWDEVVDVFNAAYAGYIVPLSMSADDLRYRCIAEDVSMDHSVVVRCDGRNVAIVLIALRGSRARLAAFGVASDWRGRGLGAIALSDVLPRVPGIERWELEVIAQNTPALRLYEKAGFRVVDRLHGYERAPVADGGEAHLSRITAQEVADRMSSIEDLPWQLDRRTLGRARAPWFGVHDANGSCAVINDEPKDVLALRWFFDHPHPGRYDGALIRSIAARYATTRPIRMVPLVPSAYDDKLVAMGFVRQALFQLRMIRETGAGA
jgi:ribosomal protein S18 acetylase RimI-like enzyme